MCDAMKVLTENNFIAFFKHLTSLEPALLKLGTQKKKNIHFMNEFSKNVPILSVCFSSNNTNNL